MEVYIKCDDNTNYMLAQDKRSGTVYKNSYRRKPVAVVIKYIVERNGEEKMTFTSKKEADAYDKMLDIADQLSDFLATGPVGLDDSQLEELGLFLAANKDDVMSMLKGAAPVANKKPATKDEKKLKLASENAA